MSISNPAADPEEPPASPAAWYSPRPAAPARLAFWLALLLLAVYLLSFSGKFHVMDELAVFTAGHNLACYGRADINLLIWTNHWTPNPPGIWGQDGQLYTKKAPGISVLAAPLIWLGHVLPGLNAAQVGLLTNSFVTALTAGLLLIWLGELGFSRRASLLAALGYGLGTIAWVYARMFWESSLLALFFLAAVWSAWRAIHRPHPWPRWAWFLLSGAAGAIGISLRFEAVVAVLLVGGYLLWSDQARSFEQRPQAATGGPAGAGWRLALYLVPTVLMMVALLAFNLARFGSLTETGYTRELLFRAPWLGSYGLLFSPGRGLFITSPLLLLLFFGLRPAWRRLPRPYFWLVAALCLFYWLFYGSWFAWGGTWGWGPRFLLPILPLLTLFITYPLEWAFAGAARSRWPARLGIAVLFALSLFVNFLGIVVDFNEYFLRLGRNDDFVFNWRVFPPLGHWRILKEGLVDLLWLPRTGAGLSVEWSVLLPPLVLLAIAAVGLAGSMRPAPQVSGRQKKSSWTLPLVIVTSLLLIYLMMVATARVPPREDQAQLDAPLLDALAAETRPGDVLLVPMPPFGDVQEITTRLMAYLEPALPTWAWIESPPRAVEPEERQRLLDAAGAGANRIWLFERWLTQSDPTLPTTAQLDKMAFPLQSRWLDRSGRLTLFALPRQLAGDSLPVNVPFVGGVTLVDFTLFDLPPHPGDVLKVRLTWQVAPVEKLREQQVPVVPLIASVQLLDENGARPVAQQDRLLLDLQNVKQSPLLPGNTLPQGYGLQLDPQLPPGRYPLLVNLYRPGNGERLSRADGSPDDFLYLTTINVEAGP